MSAYEGQSGRAAVIAAGLGLRAGRPVWHGAPSFDVFLLGPSLLRRKQMARILVFALVVACGAGFTSSPADAQVPRHRLDPAYHSSFRRAGAPPLHFARSTLCPSVAARGSATILANDTPSARDGYVVACRRKGIFPGLGEGDEPDLRSIGAPLGAFRTPVSAR
jgi:hypothetical protein